MYSYSFLYFLKEKIMALYYSEEQYKRAKAVNLIAYLKSKGHDFKKEGYRYRHKEHDSLIISEDNKWYWNSKGIFGVGAISYLHKAEGSTIPEAVNELLKQHNGPLAQLNEHINKEEKRPFVLPKHSNNYRRAFAFLHKTRGIDAEIISKLMQEKKIYESLPYYNVVFLGFDKSGKPRHASLYGTYTRGAGKPFKGELPGSDKTYGFHMRGTTKTVYVYESPIDAMSHATLMKKNDMNWKNDHRLSLCCTWDGALSRFLELNDVTKTVFCLDNDNAGNNASNKYMEKYFEKGYEVERIKPVLKDFNDDLINLKNQPCVELEGAEL
jgi:hypothetical protein